MRSVLRLASPATSTLPLPTSLCYNHLALQLRRSLVKYIRDMYTMRVSRHGRPEWVSHQSIFVVMRGVVGQFVSCPTTDFGW